MSPNSQQAINKVIGKIGFVAVIQRANVKLFPRQAALDKKCGLRHADTAQLKFSALAKQVESSAG